MKLRIESFLVTWAPSAEQVGQATAFYAVEFGLEGEPGADIFQVPVEVGLGEGITGPLPRGVVLFAADDAAAQDLVRSKISAIEAFDWLDAVDRLKKLGFKWEYEGYK